jgi:hypothetical protein
MSAAVSRPDASEYAPYYGAYIDQVSGELIAVLSAESKRTLALLGGIDEQRALYRYAEGKWSVKEVVGHIIDAERIFSYRALRFARNDLTPLPGFDQNPYVLTANFDRIPLPELAAEFACVRQSTLHLFSHFGPAEWDRRGIASEKEISVRALGWVIAGHEIHHTRILREKYL